MALRTHLKTRGEELDRHKLSSSQELKRSKQYQETISTLEEELASYKERLEKAQQRSYKTVGEDKLKNDKTPGGDLRNSFKSGVLTQGDQEKMGVEKANQTGSPGMESRQTEERTVMDRHRRETSIPATHFNSDEEERRRPTDENQEQDNIQLRREDSRRTEDSPSESDQVRNDVPLRDSDEDTGDENKKRGVDFVSATDKSVNRWDSIIKSERDSQRANQEGREGNEEGIEEEGEEVNVGERNKRSVDDAETFREQNKNEPNDVQKQPGEREMANERKGVAQLGDKDGEQNEQGHQGDEARRARAQYGEEQSNKRTEEEAQERDGQDKELSRKKINEQVAGMQEDFNKKKMHQQNQDREDQQELVQQVQKIQQQVGELSFQRNKHYEARESPTHIELTAIPVNLPRQDTVQGHRVRSDADDDDEDANTEQDTEKDPDDADEDQESDNIESFEQQQQKPQGQDTQRVKPIQGQQGLHHRERTFNRALIHADNNNNNEHSQQA